MISVLWLTGDGMIYDKGRQLPRILEKAYRIWANFLSTRLLLNRGEVELVLVEGQWLGAACS